MVHILLTTTLESKIIAKLTNIIETFYNFFSVAKIN